MLLSVVVPTCNRYEALQICLRNLSPQVQKMEEGTYEIVVSDDAPDEALRVRLNADFPNVRRTCGPRRGPAANRNNGARVSQGEWIVFIDDDCLPQATLLRAYRAALEAHPEYRVFEGKTSAERPRQRMDEEAPINETGGYLWSCNFMIRRDVFDRMEGFCEAFPYAAMEDVDLRERLRRAGEGFLFVPEAEVIHPWRRMIAEGKYLRMQLTSLRLFYRRYPELSDPLRRRFYHLMRDWIRGFLVETRLGYFRGFPKWFVRLLTRTRISGALAMDSIFRSWKKKEQS